MTPQLTLFDSARSPLDKPCHADVLLQLANAPIADKTEA
jgi:hypothetical protein